MLVVFRGIVVSQVSVGGSTMIVCACRPGPIAMLSKAGEHPKALVLRSSGGFA